MYTNLPPFLGFVPTSDSIYIIVDQMQLRQYSPTGSSSVHTRSFPGECACYLHIMLLVLSLVLLLFTIVP